MPPLLMRTGARVIPRSRDGKGDAIEASAGAGAGVSPLAVTPVEKFEMASVDAGGGTGRAAKSNLWAAGEGVAGGGRGDAAVVIPKEGEEEEEEEEQVEVGEEPVVSVVSLRACESVAGRTVFVEGT